MKRFLIFALSFALLFAVSIPAFAKTVDVGDPSLPTTAPSVADVWDSATYPYAIVAFSENSQTWFTCSSSPFADDGADEIRSNGAYVTFKLDSNNNWVRQSSGNGYVVAAPTVSLVLYSTHDLSDLHGNLLFSATPDFFNPPPPLVEVIQGVAMEEMTTTTLPQMAGTMKILVVCGVGLMACLVVLSLFGKRSLICRS